MAVPNIEYDIPPGPDESGIFFLILLQTFGLSGKVEMKNLPSNMTAALSPHYDVRHLVLRRHSNHSTGLTGGAALAMDAKGNQIIIWRTIRGDSKLHCRLLLVRSILFRFHNLSIMCWCCKTPNKQMKANFHNHVNTNRRLEPLRSDIQHLQQGMTILCQLNRHHLHLVENMVIIAAESWIPFSWP
ncbi:hypothetical protein ES288_D07G025100v1 [Gossypium darwinii]|uniref:Uncharacterized protein n=1 Tax=Gossypium darwinii TaxID=34276 RepID=A0A5D2BRQ5_GOSDA|nr:hypothetical protein ES288_D07G025100v1 [Gossypium darwinii]